MPVGAVAFDDGREAERGCGWIPLLTVAEPWRRRGYGVQLIGQAVMHYRPMGRDRLRLPTPETEAAAGFYREFGFSPAADGPAWEKFIPACALYSRWRTMSWVRRAVIPQTAWPCQYQMGTSTRPRAQR